jgi:hypothetical protein
MKKSALIIAFFINTVFASPAITPSVQDGDLYEGDSSISSTPTQSVVNSNPPVCPDCARKSLLQQPTQTNDFLIIGYTCLGIGAFLLVSGVGIYSYNDNKLKEYEKQVADCKASCQSGLCLCDFKIFDTYKAWMNIGTIAAWSGVVFSGLSVPLLVIGNHKRTNVISVSVQSNIKKPALMLQYAF